MELLVDYEELCSNQLDIVDEVSASIDEKEAKKLGFEETHGYGETFIRTKLDKANRDIKRLVREECRISNDPDVIDDLKEAVILQIRLLLFQYKRSNESDLYSGEKRIKNDDREIELVENKELKAVEQETRIKDEIDQLLYNYKKDTELVLDDFCFGANFG